jgi:flagellar biosynthesis/type III secretory pathway protein FliH
MIKRLHRGLMVESITPRTVNGGVIIEPAAFEPAVGSDDVDARAYRDGYTEGFEAGERDGRREAERLQQTWELESRQCMERELQALARERMALSTLLTSIDEQLRSHVVGMEQSAYELALASIEHILGISAKEKILVRRLCERMAEDYRGKATQLAVSASDRDSLPDHLEGLDVAVDHDLNAGECRITTHRGHVESSIGIRIGAIYRSMLESLGLPQP